MIMKTIKKFCALVVCALASLPSLAQQTYQEMEQLTINENVTTVITASEPVRFVDISTDAVVGDQPINNTIRLTVYSKRFLIHTMKLVGASRSFIRKPFLARNVWIGLLAAALADAALMVMAWLLVGYEPGLLQVITPSVMLTVMGVVLIFGILITTLCAWISINKYLGLKTEELYK